METSNLPVELRELADNTLAFTDFGGGVTRVEHSHTTGWRTLPYAVCAAISEGTTRLGYGTGEEVILQPGEAFLAPAGERHCSTLNCDHYVSRWVHFQVTVCATVDVFRLVAVPRVLGGETAARLGRLCEALEELRRRPADGLDLEGLARRKALGFELFATLAAAGKPRPDAGAVLDAVQRLAPLLRRLRAEPHRPLSLAEMARLTHLSPSRFSALFTSAMGVPPGHFQRQLRLHRAKTLLLTTGQSVAEIAAAVGFADPFHFSRAFAQATGQSPRAYRDHLRRGMW